MNTIIDAKLRSFKYKCIMHIHDSVPNNEQLFKYCMIELRLSDFAAQHQNLIYTFFWNALMFNCWCQKIVLI